MDLVRWCLQLCLATLCTVSSSYNVTASRCSRKPGSESVLLQQSGLLSRSHRGAEEQPQLLQLHTQTLARSTKFPTDIWNNKKQLFEFRADRDFMYTWQIPETASSRNSDLTAINITASDATRAAGPLTLLYVLQHCPADAVLASVVDKARTAGRIRLHLVGVNPRLEPMMTWDHFLVGPLSPDERRIIDAFGLPVTPFVGMNVSLLFNTPSGFYDTKKWKTRSGPFPESYSESYHTGLYHNAISEAPDLIFMNNPGFAHYPQSWAPTLLDLYSKGVPVIATGYGDNSFVETSSVLGKIYEYDRTLQTSHMDGQMATLWAAKFLRTKVVSDETPAGKHDVDILISEKGNHVRVHHCPVHWATSKLLGDDSNDICGDLDSNAFVAKKAGFAVRLGKRNPFAYCDGPHVCKCSSNSIVSLLEPKRLAAASALEVQASRPESLLSLYEEVALRSLSCFSSKQTVHTCMKSRILKALEPTDRLYRFVSKDNPDDLLERVAYHCVS